MAGLLYKELIINKKNLIIYGAAVLWLSVGLFTLLIGNDAESEQALMVLPLFYFLIFYVGMFQLTIFEPDETKRWAHFIISAPEAASGQIYSKYMFGFLTSLAALIWCRLLDSLASFLTGYIMSVSTLTAVVFFFVQIFLRSIEYPFIVRFGSKIGSTYKMAVFLIVVFIIFVYLLFGDLSMFGSSEKIYGMIFGMLSGEAFSGNTLLILSLFPFLIIAAYYLSYRISSKLYVKGAESLEL